MAEEHSIREQHLASLDFLSGRQHVLDELCKPYLLACEEAHVHCLLNFEFVASRHLSLAYFTLTVEVRVSLGKLSRPLLLLQLSLLTARSLINGSLAVTAATAFTLLAALAALDALASDAFA